jgi:hypothetical protein
MFSKKIYGESRRDICPFCGQLAVTENPQGVPVCVAHKKEELNDLKCACGSWLDVRKGKFGAYFSCMNCGNINFRRGLEMNDKIRKQDDAKVKKPVREITITSDDVEFL